MHTTENNTSWRSALQNGLIYSLVQLIFSERLSKQLILNQFVIPAGKSCRVLDMGCGPGNLLNFLPNHVTYIGYDVSPTYIEFAKKKIQQRINATFLCGTGSDATVSKAVKDESIDVVIIHGVLHHVAAEMFALAKKKLAPNGRMVVLEPVWFDQQPQFHKKIMQLDRGRNIKHEAEWIKLCNKLCDGWADYTTQTRSNLTRFYDLIVMSIHKK